MSSNSKYLYRYRYCICQIIESSKLNLKEFFTKAGITKEDLRDKEKREFICQFLRANIDGLFKELGIFAKYL